MKPITKHIFILFFSLLFLNSFKTQAQETDSLNLSLKQAVQKGLENNFGIRISKKDLNAAENSNSWGKAGLLPSVSVGANQTNRYDNSASQFSAGRDESYMNSLTPYLNLRMNLFSGFSVKISKENLEHLQSLSEGNLQMTLENSIADIINAYNSVLLENEKLKVTKDLMQLSKDRYNYILMKKDLGLSVSYQVLQEKNSFLTDSSNYLTQLMNTQNVMRELGKTLGDNNIINYILTDSLEIKDKNFILADLENQMYENNASLNIQYINNKIVENNIKLAKSSLYPSLSLNAGADHTNSMMKYNTQSSTSYSYDAYANLALTYTVFNGNNRKRAIENAKIDAEKSQLQIDELKMILRNNLYNLFEMYRIRKQMLKVAEENFKAASLNLEISQEKFKSGIINSFNYRDVQILYMNAAFALSQSKYYLLVKYNDLLRMTGKISEEYQ
ncbi:MAG: hypothetical protein DRI94_03495 [Bacteroidetes bacterium]|nr:MAG: hypothetical protein DRI94_03495 [Bacteroidota bacterium]